MEHETRRMCLGVWLPSLLFPSPFVDSNMVRLQFLVIACVTHVGLVLMRNRV